MTARQILSVVFLFSMLSATAQEVKTELYPNGNKKSEKDSKNNRYREWYEDGKPKVDTQLVSINDFDRMNAHNREWYPNGKLKYETKISENKDVMYQYEYYDSGNVSKISTYLAILDNTTRDAVLVYAKSYWDNGQLQVEGPANLTGQYSCVTYHRNGKVNLIYSQLMGAMNGLQTEYWDNGKVKAQGFNEDNNKVGMWHYYDREGVLIRAVNHQGGRVISESSVEKKDNKE